MSTDVDELAQLRSSNEELKGKLERWKAQSKLGIEQHRNRIRELTVKWNAGVEQIAGLEVLNKKLQAYYDEACALLFSSLVQHSTEYQEAARDVQKKHLAHYTGTMTERMEQERTALQTEVKEKEEALRYKEDQLQSVVHQLEELTMRHGDLEAHVQLLSAQQESRESTATNESVLVALRTARDEFETELAATRMAYEEELRSLHLSHEAEIARLQEEMAYRVAMVREETSYHCLHHHHAVGEAPTPPQEEEGTPMERVSSTHPATTTEVAGSSFVEVETSPPGKEVRTRTRTTTTSATNPTANGQNRRNTDEKEDQDDSYWALFHSHQSLEKEVQMLRQENHQLKEEVWRLEEHQQPSPPEKDPYKESAWTRGTPIPRDRGCFTISSSSSVAMEGVTSPSNAPGTLEEARSVIEKLQSRSSALLTTICDLQLQLGALKEHPPVPKGGLSPDQVLYLSNLIHKMYTSGRERERLMAALAPAVGEVLGVPEERLVEWKRRR